MKKNIIYYALSALLLAGCTEDLKDTVAQQMIPIHVGSTYPVAGVTRATDNGFVADDAVGIFVVDYNDDGTPDMPALSSNRGSNVKFTYDGGTWSASYQLYWADGKTPADFYGYYPYDESLSSVTEYAFAVSRNQDSTAAEVGYEASDLLWTKAEKVSPTAETIQLQYKHLMAGVTVSLEMGSGFTATEWTGLEKVVQIEHTVLSGTVDLSKGICSVGNAAPETITPLAYNAVWRSVVFPQTVKAGTSLLSVTVDGQRYQLVKEADFTYYSGKMHNFTIVVNRSTTTGDFAFTLKADDIVAWVDDADLHDGLVREYWCVEVKEPGTLEATIRAAGKEPSEVRSMKVNGVINHSDLYFMGNQMSLLMALNLRDVTITGTEEEKDVLVGFDKDKGMRTSGGILKHIIFPENLRKIGDRAFVNAGLTGRILIPDGVEYIGQDAFCFNDLKGEIKLPSSLKILRGGAFAYNSGLSGELILPDGLEIIGPHEEGSCNTVFHGCNNLSGTLVLPESLKEMDGLGYSGICGTLKIPQCMKIVNWGEFERGGCTQVEFHDGISKIGISAFSGSALSGELVLPSNLEVLSGNAFSNTKISKIIFPDNLRSMGAGEFYFLGNYAEGYVFSNCQYLTGILTLPKNVISISKRCFYNCPGITGLIIPEGVDIIESEAFFGCYGIKSIICEDEEPPVISEDTFFGVNKDNVTVEVPKGCVEKYRQAPGWSQFKRIAEYSNFVCRPAQANALNTQHAETLILNADGAWEVEHCPDWVTLSKTSGTGKTELRLTFNPMEHGAGNRRDSILFRMPEEGYTTCCVVSQYDYTQEEDSYLALQEHTKGNGIDIVFIGDGFDGESIADGSYLELVKQQTEYFFGLEPYKSHREYFNVYVTFPLSQEKGVNTMYTYVNNRFGTLHGVDEGCSYNQLLTETDEVYDYALHYSPLKEDRINESLVVLVPNCADYSGNTVYAVNGCMTISICPPSNRPYPEDTRGVIQHEAGGHGFGKLADEEIQNPDCQKKGWPSVEVINEVEERHGWGWYQNIATTSNMNQVPWADFIFDTRYSDYVDVYEGGYGYMRGIFRSEANSCMNYGIPYYNAISRMSIMRRIKEYAGEWFTMDYFYEHDSNKWGDRDGTTRAGTAHAYLTGSSYAGSNQHCEPRMVDAKKQGDRVRKIRAELKKKRDSKRF